MTEIHKQSPASAEIPPELIRLTTALQRLVRAHEAEAQGGPKETVDECIRVMNEALLHLLDASKQRRSTLSLIQEALGQLRLDMKYLIFDLEATRRERDEYRKELEGRE